LVKYPVFFLKDKKKPPEK